MSDLMPNASYHSKSVVLSGTFRAGNTIMYNLIYSLSTVSDTGVFVSGNTNLSYPGCTRSDKRITSRYTYNAGGSTGYRYCPAGGINMDVGDDETSLYSFAIAGFGTGSSQYFALAFQKGFKISDSLSDNNFVLTSPSQAGLGMSAGIDYECCILAEKVEVSHKTESKEIVYATGVTMSIQVNGAFAYHGGMILARSIPMVGSGFAESTSNGSILFTHDGMVRSMIQGDNVSSIATSVISQAIPTAAMVSNDGVAAVSCMAKADGYAQWLGYKNGIYKLYQGRTPLNGMPGEKVTIKGHEFVCLAYGPFYARMT